MAMQRFLPDVERTRRAAGWIFLAIALALLVGMGWWELSMGRLSGTAFVLSLFPLVLAGLGLRLALRPQEFFEIDLEKRRFAVFREGKQLNAGPLDNLGPLTVSQRVRVTTTSDDRRRIVRYVVSAAVHSKIDLYAMSSAGAARQKMEQLARAWHLPCQSLGGVVRAAGEVDVPLHERLRADRVARTAMPLRPEWHVRVEPLSPGYAIVSTYRSWAPLRASAFIVGALLLGIGYGGPTRLFASWREMQFDLVQKVLAGLMGVVVLVMFWVVIQGVRDTFYPGTVHITEQGVAYRGSKMRFDEIEEITAALPIELVGDRRILRLAESFCPRGAVGAVAHELQRLILEVAPFAAGPQ
jgi:hypothetical protein